MKITKIIAISLAAISILSLSSCAKKFCDVCKEVPPTHSIKSPREADLCDFCYQRAILLETDVDVATIKETDFAALTDAQKNYIVIFVKERIGYYDTMWGEPVNDELEAKVLDEAAVRYDKTAEEIKSLVDAHDSRGVQK